MMQGTPKLRNNLRSLLAKHYGVDPSSLPSQVQIAEDFGVSQTTVSRWLSQKVDRFDADVLIKFCRAFKCNVGELVYFDPQEIELGVAS